MRSRANLGFGSVLMGVALLLIGRNVGSAALSSVATAAIAASALVWVLHGPGLRAVCVLLVALAVLATVLGGTSGGWGWLALAPAAGLVAGSVAAWRAGPHWAARAQQDGVRAAPTDPWQQLDAGDDPTRTR